MNVIKGKVRFRIEFSLQFIYSSSFLFKKN